LRGDVRMTARRARVTHHDRPRLRGGGTRFPPAFDHAPRPRTAIAMPPFEGLSSIRTLSRLIESTVLARPHRRRRSMLRAAALACGQWRETAQMTPRAMRQAGTTRCLQRLAHSACE